MKGDFSKDVRLNLDSACRLRHDTARDEYLLLLPERVVKLNRTAFLLLSMSDGTKAFADVLNEMISEYGENPDYLEEAKVFLQDALSRGWVGIHSEFHGSVEGANMRGGLLRHTSNGLTDLTPNDTSGSTPDSVPVHKPDSAPVHKPDSAPEHSPGSVPVQTLGSAPVHPEDCAPSWALNMSRDACHTSRAGSLPRSVQPPYGLTVELTHRCPLQCLYCSNPVDLTNRGSELSTSEWIDVVRQAKALGVVEIHLSGGEPLARPDLIEIVRTCTELDIYSNLITSGVGLTEHLLEALKSAGLCSVQLSFQSDDEATSRKISGVNALRSKCESAQMLSQSGLPLTLNVVLSALNICRLDSILKLCTSYGARRIEIANCQYYGWALVNRSVLLPTLSQLKEAKQVVERWRTVDLNDTNVEIVWVMPDYFEDFPKPCSGGWAQRQLIITPNGIALPCAAAEQIDSIEFPSARRSQLGWIWNESDAFNRYRGYDWMKEPCLTCERKEVDFGGCRCQAFILTGDASEADPVCTKSTRRQLIDELVESRNSEEPAELSYRGAF
ncbi:MAG: pyrroloquinoline quinone biosynthesis protein PqqE [Candidatus Obscuribacterales bacterium]|nr:pyrroloquinoline quinone biosynthesis protein PqqE [Candidatus Obscuribacterales bacterium]